LVLLISCNSNKRKQTKVDQQACTEPPSEFYTSKIGAKFDANFLPIIKQAFNADMSIESKIERLRKEQPEVYKFEVIAFQMCLARRRGDITQDQYAEFLGNILPSLYEKPSTNFLTLNIVTEGVPIGATLSVIGSTISTTVTQDTTKILLPVGYFLKEITVKLQSMGHASQAITFIAEATTTVHFKMEE